MSTDTKPPAETELGRALAAQMTEVQDGLEFAEDMLNQTGWGVDGEVLMNKLGDKLAFTHMKGGINKRSLVVVRANTVVPAPPVTLRLSETSRLERAQAVLVLPSLARMLREKATAHLDEIAHSAAKVKPVLVELRAICNIEVHEP